jgi:hypothetical protein
MQNITKNAPRGNMTGNRSISIASTDEISAIKLSTFNSKTVVFNTNHSFGKIEAGNIQFNFQEEDGRYIHEVSCRLASTQGKYDALFNRMKNKRWIVSITDNNNITWLIGSLTEPLHFRWEHIGEDKASGLHCYDLFFGREGTEPIYAAGDHYLVYKEVNQQILEVEQAYNS